MTTVWGSLLKKVQSFISFCHIRRMHFEGKNYGLTFLSLRENGRYTWGNSSKTILVHSFRLIKFCENHWHENIDLFAKHSCKNWSSLRKPGGKPQSKNLYQNWGSEKPNWGFLDLPVRCLEKVKPMFSQMVVTMVNLPWFRIRKKHPKKQTQVAGGFLCNLKNMAKSCPESSR